MPWASSARRAPGPPRRLPRSFGTSHGPRERRSGSRPPGGAAAAPGSGASCGSAGRGWTVAWSAVTSPGGALSWRGVDSIRFLATLAPAQASISPSVASVAFFEAIYGQPLSCPQPPDTGSRNPAPLLEGPARSSRPRSWRESSHEAVAPDGPLRAFWIFHFHLVVLNGRVLPTSSPSHRWGA